MKKYQQAKMVNWFEPRMLLQTGIKSVISGLFGNYADRREMEAALDDQDSKNLRNKEFEEYIEREEMWVDFISDTGDGFNPTYSVALTAAQQNLNVKIDGIDKELPRAKILVLGGDQIYPTPTGEIYDNKFRIPFEAALPEDNTDPDFPHMYAIPGNHDWYDGLGNFMKVFCQQRWIGNWKTFQSRSYFAVPLPHNYWLWATDIQLNEDIDKPQQDYFRNVASNKMPPGSKVILCTAEPAWVYKQLYKEDRSYSRLQFFIETYITKDKIGCVGKTFSLATVLTGDLHHYSHYCSKDESGASNHYFGAGGGGAFLHLTHNLPKKLDKLDEKGVKLEKAFPDKKESYSLLKHNLAFPVKNRYFSFLIGVIYLLFFWLLQSHSFASSDTGYMETISDSSFSDFLSHTGKQLLTTPILSILSLVVITGFFKFTDTKTDKKGVKSLGLLHGLLQCFMIYLAIWIVANIHHRQIITDGFIWWIWPVIIAELVFFGGLMGGFLMGIYLYLSNRFLGIHIDESSSSLVCEDYKNFLRMHISKEGLTIYPIGIRKTTKDWKQEENGERISFKGKLPQYELIENPIFIKNTIP